MKRYCYILLLLLVSGCGGASRAQDALHRGQESLRSIHRGMSVHAWGMNRALITESRDKHIAQTKLGLLKKQLEAGQITFAQAEMALDKLGKELGINESYTSENFAYIMMMQIGAERAHQSLGITDGYLESKKPIWKQFFREEKKGMDFINEFQNYAPLFHDPQKVARDFNGQPAK